MNYKTYQPEIWRLDESRSEAHEAGLPSGSRSASPPDIFDRGLLLELLGRINYQIVSGNRVYIEAGGVVYKALFGGYWRSVFTGVEHYSIKCEAISGAAWADDLRAGVVDLPIVFSNNAWCASGHSLSFMLSRDPVTADQTKHHWNRIFQHRVKSYRERARGMWC